MKLNLRTKLIGSFVIMLLLMVIIGLGGIHASRHIKNHMEDILEQDIKPASILGVVARRVAFIQSNSLLHLLTSSIDDMTRYESEIADWADKINTNLDSLENMLKNQTTLDKLAEFRADWNTYLRIWNEQVIPLSRAARDEEAFALAKKGGAAGMAAQEAMYKLDELHNAIIARADNSLVLAEQHFRNIQIILLSIILLAIILGLAFGIKQSSHIAGAVNTVSEAAQLVAAGNLDQRVKVKTGDEIESMADSFNTMTGNLRKMVEELRREITERHRAEETLRESKQWLSTTLRSIGDAVIATDAQGLVTFMNPVAGDLTGWDEAEGVGRPMEDIFNIINEQTGQPVENPAARVLQEGVVVGLANDTILIARDGMRRPIADSGAPIRDEEGNVIGTVMVFRDITELKRTEEEIASLAKFPSENLNPVLRVAKDGAILYANESSLPLLNVWGCQVGQLLPHDWRKFTLDVVDSGSGKDAEVEYDDRILSLTFAPVVDKDYVNVYGLDITELKEMQQQLVRKEKLAVLGQLSGGVGHELRNPLGVISNAVYFLQMTLSDADETTIEYLGIISSEVRTAEKIVSDLLDLSRIRPAEREKIAVSELVDQVVEKQPPPDKIEVNTEIPSELPPVFVDPMQIGQVLFNLVTNAYQAMPDGGKLTIGAQAEKKTVSLFITDTGCGISEETMEKIFEPLFTTRARGIGLGLAVSKNLVDVNGGSIEVQSEEGKGTTFTITLPIKEAVS